jgi:hypothetical protein
MDANAEVLAAARAFTDNHAAVENAVLWCLECHTRFYLGLLVFSAISDGTQS